MHYFTILAVTTLTIEMVLVEEMGAIENASNDLILILILQNSSTHVQIQ